MYTADTKETIVNNISSDKVGKTLPKDIIAHNVNTNNENNNISNNEGKLMHYDEPTNKQQASET